MSLSDFIRRRFDGEIRSHFKLDAKKGSSRAFPPTLLPSLRKVLEKDGITSLYSHQAEAFGLISANTDTVVVSRTASGKTLSFLLPILNEYAQADQKFGVLLLYPTKALSRDQEGTLGKLMRSALGQRNLGTFDGDTPPEERAKILKSADFVITNPDMLHNGILPNHSRAWKTFLSRLRYVVIDEVHTYRGAFGSHVSNVFRRLLRVCELHGSKPCFICSSATIGNPEEHARALLHRNFHILRNDGAPTPARELFFVNPEMATSQGGVVFRKGTGSVSVHLIREAVKQGVRTICFCRARQEVERLYRAVCDGHPRLRELVKPYRGGLLPSERRSLEKGLFEGKLKGIITTNALELGIDIGDLDLCILSGHPGSLASFWQQAGRVGRKKDGAIIAFVARASPIDQYLVHHPDFVSAAPVERAWLNADNPYIILQHLPCAAYEHPLRADEPLFDAKIYQSALEVLREGKVVLPYKQFFRYSLPDYPARGVNLRGMTDYNVEIHHGSEVIGEIDPIGARGTLYKDAIYLHLGRKFMSMELDLEKKLCRVEPAEVDYYTEAVWEKRLTMTEAEEEKKLHGTSLRFGYLNVNKQPKLYKKIRERSFENVGYGPITLPPFEYDTSGFLLLPSPDWKRALERKEKRYVGAALYGLAYILRRTAPSLCLGDTGDIETDVAVAETETDQWENALYLYDTVEGGVGYGEKIFELFPAALELCQRILSECECESGCPSCVPPLPPGVEDVEVAEFLVESNAAVECTLSLVRNLLSGKVQMPKVKELRRRLPAPEIPPPEDWEAKNLEIRLRKAASLLDKKRQRQH